MKRTAFISAILGSLGIARAQQWRGQKCGDYGFGYERFRQFTYNGITCTDLPALNNQCPVCGEMAEPYVRQRVAKWSDCKGGVAPTSMSDCYWTPSGPTERITRCRRCNNAFWVDAEGAK